MSQHIVLGDPAMRKVGIGALASGCGLTAIGLGQVATDLMPPGSLMAEAAWPVLIVGQLIAMGGTIIYWWAAGGGKPWQMEVDVIVATVPLVGPLVILSHMMLRERGESAPWLLRAYRIVSMVLIGALVVVARCS